MSNDQTHLNEFQVACLDALRRLGAELDVDVVDRDVHQYSDGIGVGIDVGGVPIEVAPDQVDIATPYNGRVFERRDFERDSDLELQLIDTVRRFVSDPVMASHPIYRFVTRLRRLVGR